jgi:hypothetical protein
MKKHTSGWVEMKAAAVNVGTVGTESRRDQLVSSVLYQAVVGLDVSDRQTHYCVLCRPGNGHAE